MNAADVIADLERRFTCLPGPYRAFCQTGDAYADIGLEKPLVGEVYTFCQTAPPGGIRPGARRARYDTEDEACRVFLSAFDLYEMSVRMNANWPLGNPGLYWRYLDKAVWHDDDGVLKCRLALSFLPVVEISEADYDAARTAELERDILGRTSQ